MIRSRRRVLSIADLPGQTSLEPTEGLAHLPVLEAATAAAALDTPAVDTPALDTPALHTPALHTPALHPPMDGPLLEDNDATPGEPAEEQADVNAGWVELVERIRLQKTDGMEELYQLFSRGIRFYLCRQLGPQELDDKVHDTFVVVVQAIRRGELREPERLMGFVRTIVRRQVAAHIDKVVHNRREQAEFDSTVRVVDPRGNPEETAIFKQRIGLIRKVLGELSERDREILTRFYIDEQSQDQICSEMGLTETQFRLLKSRAKARFGELGKKKLVHKNLSTVFLRTSRSASH